MKPDRFLIAKSKLRFWYQKGFVVPLAISFKSPLEPWQIAKSILGENQYVFFLDSVRYQKKIGRYSYLGWNPFRIFRAKQAAGIIGKLRHLLGSYKGRKWKGLPFFTGGAVGYFSYELAHAFEQLPDLARDDLHLDPVLLMLTRDLLVFDHKENNYFLISNLIPSKDGSFEKAFERAKNVILSSPRREREKSFKNGHVRIRNFRADMSKQKFKQMVMTAKKYIEAGDIYQANLSQRFSFGLSGSAETIYETLRNINPSPFSSFLKMGGLTVASASPERLIRLNGRR